MRSTLIIGTAVVGLVTAGTLAACGTDTSSGSTDLKKPAATTSTVTKSAQPAGPKTSFGDGKYKVGRDIAPGTYRTAGPADSSLPNCYWAREKNDSGELDAIIANDDAVGQTSVTVNTGEFFETNGCQTWHKG
jgi:hypothetical protein